MKLLMFAGAGSVGKTVLMEMCQAMAEARGLKVKTHHSSTRKTYAKAGLTSESDALKDPAFNRQFQHTVMQDNIDQLQAAVTDAYLSKAVDLFITDRAPYDYAGYYFSTFRENLNLEIIEAKRNKCDEAMLHLSGYVTETRVVTLPYPTSWAKDTESSDGWRADKTGKNFVWSCVVEAELIDAQRRLLDLSHGMIGATTFTRLPSFMERGSVEARAVGALSLLFPHLR